MTLRPYESVASIGGGESAVLDLIDAADALERELDLDAGAVLRELTSLLRRRRAFEALRRDHDVRRH